MRRIRFWVTLALLVGSSTGLVACGDDPVQPATGTLQVGITGLPAGTAAAVTVEGPGGTQQLTESRTLSALSVGRYNVSAGAVPGFAAQVSGSPATVSAGATTLVRVVYTATGGPDPGTGGSISGTVSVVGTAGAADDAPFVPGEVIVKFKPELRAQGLAQGSAGLELLREFSLENTGLYRTVGVSSQSADSKAATLQAVAALAARDDVVYAHPNYILEAFAEPNDPLYERQWHYEAINLPAAWDRTQGSADVTVAVIDSGVVTDHPDLASKLAPGYDFVSDEQTAGDGDGRDADPTDPAGSFHGSHVAGTVAAATDNGVGVAGVSWGARILPVRVLGNGNGTLADAVDGILWSVGDRVPGVPLNPDPADVINLSLGGKFLCSKVQFLQDAFDLANAVGVAVVVAAGNDDEDANGFTPASCGGVITVGATTLEGERAYYSNYGDRIDVMAPGGNLDDDSDGDGEPDGVLSTVQNASGEPDYAYFEGTSMASPHVAGVVALLKSVRPELSGSEARDLLKRTARPIRDSSCSVGCGSGLIDAEAALAELAAPARPDFALALSPATVSLTAGTDADIQVVLSRSGGFDSQVSFSVAGLPDGLSASFTPSATTGDSARLTLRAEAGLEGEYALSVEGSGGGVNRTVSLSVVVEGDEPPEPSLSIAGTYVFACPVSERECNVSKLPSVQIETGGVSASYTIPNVPAGDYNVLGWNDLNRNRKVDAGEPVGAFPSFDTPAVVKPPASGVDFVVIPSLGTQTARLEGSIQAR